MRILPFALVSLLAAPVTAQDVQFGSSPNPVGSGARALGWGNAFVAVADDATAASWNPSGLIALERPEASLVLDLQSRREYYSGVGIDYAAGDDRQSATSGDVNYFAVAYPFKLAQRSFVASLNYQALMAFDKRSRRTVTTTDPATGIVQERRIRLAQTGDMRALTPALAFQLSPQISLGIAVSVWTSALGYGNGWTQRERVALTTRLANGLVQIAETDEKSRFDHTGVGANIGLLWDITPQWTVGAVLKTPVWGTLSRRVEHARVESRLLDGTPTQDPIELTGLEFDEPFNMPPSYGVGVAYRRSDSLTVSADISRIEWGLFKHRRTFDLETGARRGINPISGQPYRDADVSGVTQIRVGAEQLFIFPRTVVPVRAGLFYDPEPATGRLNHFFGLALGTGVSIGNVIIDAAYQFRFSTSAALDGFQIAGDTELLTQESETGAVRQHQFYLSTIVHL